MHEEHFFYTVQLTCKFTTYNGLNVSILDFQEARGFTCVSCTSEEICAVLIACFKSIARKRRNNACDVTRAMHVAIMRRYVYTYVRS